MDTLESSKVISFSQERNILLGRLFKKATQRQRTQMLTTQNASFLPKLYTTSHIEHRLK